jgi:hypothetical protein
LELAGWAEIILGPEGEGAEKVLLCDLKELAGLNRISEVRVRTDLDIMEAGRGMSECVIIAALSRRNSDEADGIGLRNIEVRWPISAVGTQHSGGAESTPFILSLTNPQTRFITVV